MLSLTNCAGSEAMAPGAKPTVAIPARCERLARRVAEPELRRANVKVMLAEHVVALESANNRLDAARACQRRLRERFAKGSSR